LSGEGKMTCAYRCISPECFDEVYAKDEVCPIPILAVSCLRGSAAPQMRACYTCALKRWRGTEGEWRVVLVRTCHMRSLPNLKMDARVFRNVPAFSKM